MRGRRGRRGPIGLTGRAGRSGKSLRGVRGARGLPGHRGRPGRVVRGPMGLPGKKVRPLLHSVRCCTASGPHSFVQMRLKVIWFLAIGRYVAHAVDPVGACVVDRVHQDAECVALADRAGEQRWMFVSEPRYLEPDILSPDILSPDILSPIS